METIASTLSKLSPVVLSDPSGASAGGGPNRESESGPILKSDSVPKMRGRSFALCVTAPEPGAIWNVYSCENGPTGNVPVTL